MQSGQTKGMMRVDMIALPEPSTDDDSSLIGSGEPTTAMRR